jgi:hypothetical protein
MKGRRCAICGRQGQEGCAAFLSLLIRWGFYAAPDKVNGFAHPTCVGREQNRRRGK